VEVLRLVERRFGRVAAQRLLRVRNEAGEMALHIALRSGTSLRTNADSLPCSLAPCVWAHSTRLSGLLEEAAVLLSFGAPLAPSREEQHRLSRLWKRPLPSPLDVISTSRRSGA
jgi:hypothetical protein